MDQSTTKISPDNRKGTPEKSSAGKTTDATVYGRGGGCSPSSALYVMEECQQHLPCTNQTRSCQSYPLGQDTTFDTIEDDLLSRMTLISTEDTLHVPSTAMSIVRTARNEDNSRLSHFSFFTPATTTLMLICFCFFFD